MRKLLVIRLLGFVLQAIGLLVLISAFLLGGFVSISGMIIPTETGAFITLNVNPTWYFVAGLLTFVFVAANGAIIYGVGAGSMLLADLVAFRSHDEQ